MKAKLILMSLLVLLLAGSAATAGVKKFWRYGHEEKRTWDFRDIDQWGGENFWCMNPGSTCGKYDWKAEYPSISSPSSLPSYTNTATYGHDLVLAACIVAGVPEPMSTPDYSWESY